MFNDKVQEETSRLHEESGMVKKKFTHSKTAVKNVERALTKQERLGVAKMKDPGEKGHGLTKDQKQM